MLQLRKAAAKFGLAAIIASTACFQTATAAENLDYEIFGFSADGKYFAYEEHHSENTDGWGYSKISIIEVAKDKFAFGTPFEEQATESTASDWNDNKPKDRLAETIDKEMRMRTRKRATAAFDKMKPFQKGHTRYFASPWDFTHDGSSARFSVVVFSYNLGNIENTKMMRLDLKNTDLGSRDNCYGGKLKGLNLVITNEKTGWTKVLSKGKRVPKSRGCPLSYRIERVVSLGGLRSQGSLAIFIRYGTRGFEGIDGRTMVITTRIPSHW